MNRLDFEELNDAYLNVKKQKVVIGTSSLPMMKNNILTEKKTAVTTNDKLGLDDIQDAYGQMRFERSTIVRPIVESKNIECIITENKPIVDKSIFRAEDDIMSAYRQVRINEGIMSGLADAGKALMKGISGIMAGIAQMFKNMFAAKTGGAQKTEAGGGAGGTTLPNADDVVKKDGTALTAVEKERYTKFKEEYEKSISTLVTSIGAAATTMKKDFIPKSYDFIPTIAFNDYQSILATEGMKKISQKFLVDVSIFGMENVDTVETLHKHIIDTCNQTEGKIFANTESVFTIMSSCMNGDFSSESKTGVCASLILYMGSKFFSKELGAFTKSTILTLAQSIPQFVKDKTKHSIAPSKDLPYTTLNLTEIDKMMIEGKAPDDFLNSKALPFCSGILSTLKDAKITPTKRILNKLITAMNKGNAFLTIDAENKPGRGKVDPAKFAAQITPEMFKDTTKMDTPAKKIGTYNTTILASMIWAIVTSDVNVLSKVDVSCAKVIELIENYNGISTEGINIKLGTSDEEDKPVEMKLETSEDIDKVLKQITDLPAADISEEDTAIYDNIKNILDKKKTTIAMKDGEEKTKALAEVDTLEKEFETANKKSMIEWLKEKLKAKVEEKPKESEAGVVTPIAELTPEAADDLSKKLTAELTDIDASVATAEADATKAAESLKSAKDMEGKGGTDAERKKAEEVVKKAEAKKVSEIKNKEMATAAISIVNEKSALEKARKNKKKTSDHEDKLNLLLDEFQKKFEMTFDQWQSANAGKTPEEAKASAEAEVAAVDNEDIRIDNVANVKTAKARLADIIAKGEAEEKAKDEAIKKAEAEFKVSQDKAKATKNEAEKAVAEKAAKAKDDEIKKLKDEMQKLKDEAEKAKAVKVIVDLADTKTKAEDAGKDKEAGAAGGEILKKEQELKDKLGTSAEEFLNKPEEEKPEDKKEEKPKEDEKEEPTTDDDKAKIDKIKKDPLHDIEVF